MLHYAAKDIYEPVIIAPYYNVTTGKYRAQIPHVLLQVAHANTPLQAI